MNILRTPIAPTRARHQSPGQHGTVLVVSLIILTVMLISAAALVRSFDTTLTSAGNLAFKRDLAQQSELASETILALFRTGNHFSTRDQRAQSDEGYNYSAVVLPSNPQGIPLALLTNEPLDEDIGTRPDITGRGGVQIRYLVDRMCSSAGDDRTLGADRCVYAGGSAVPGGDVPQWLGDAAKGSSAAPGAAGAGGGGAAAQPVVYRLSIRATGPRNTQAFFQTTFSCCDN